MKKTDITTDNHEQRTPDINKLWKRALDHIESTSKLDIIEILNSFWDPFDKQFFASRLIQTIENVIEIVYWILNHIEQFINRWDIDKLTILPHTKCEAYELLQIFNNEFSTKIDIESMMKILFNIHKEIHTRYNLIKDSESLTRVNFQIFTFIHEFEVFLTRIKEIKKAKNTDDITGLPKETQCLLDIKERKAKWFFIIRIDNFDNISLKSDEHKKDSVKHAYETQYSILRIITQELYKIKEIDPENIELYRLKWAKNYWILIFNEEIIQDKLIPALTEILRSWIISDKLIWTLALTIGGDINFNNHNSPWELIWNVLETMREAKKHTKETKNIFYFSEIQEKEELYKKLKAIRDIEIKRIEDEQRMIMNWEMDYNDIRNYIEERFVPFLQPIVNKDWKIIKFEMLARFFRDDKSILPPYKFIPLCEEKWLIPDITRINLWKVFKLYSLTKNKRCNITINVSESILEQKHFFNFITWMLEQLWVPCKMVTLEILEWIKQSRDDILRLIWPYKEKWFIIAVDDFGADWSSLNRTYFISPHAVKLDWEMTRNCTNTDKDANFIKVVTSFAEWLDSDTVAECVETEEQLETLKWKWVKYFQWYYFSKPLHYNDFKILLLYYDFNIPIQYLERLWCTPPFDKEKLERFNKSYYESIKG